MAHPIYLLHPAYFWRWRVLFTRGVHQPRARRCGSGAALLSLAPAAHPLLANARCSRVFAPARNVCSCALKSAGDANTRPGNAGRDQGQDRSPRIRTPGGGAGLGHRRHMRGGDLGDVRWALVAMNR
jgi:hypothetical protein